MHPFTVADLSVAAPSQPAAARQARRAEQLTVRPGPVLAAAGVGLLLLLALVASMIVRTLRRPYAADTGALVAHTDSAAEAARGRAIYMSSCASCHGTRGQGVPRQGSALADSAFVRKADREQLVKFLRAGRMPGDPGSVMNLYMPPRGGNPSLRDADLAAVSAYVRTLQPTGRTEHAR